MKISEIIEGLAKIAEEYGDVDVEVRNEAGEWYSAENITPCLHRKPASAAKWVATVDTL